MLNDEVINRMADILADRIDDLQETIITEIAKSMKQLGRLTPTQAHKLVQTMRFGSSYNNIINKIRQITKLNKKQIMEIFEETARQDQEFAKVFYEARGIDYIPYDKNVHLQRFVEAMANVSQKTFDNMINSSAFKLNINGKNKYTPIARIYDEMLDRAITSVSMGQETAEQVIQESIEELVNSGIRSVDFASGRSMRLDSAVRMHVMDGMRQLSNELQEQFGKEYKADGIEVSHHINAAPDHIDTIDGKQFFKPMTEKEKTQKWKEVDGKKYYNFDLMNESLDRPVSTMNCYHYTFSIVLGVTPPSYSDKQLERDKKRNQKGFEFEGKHYTMYEGTQLQRSMELKIRKMKEKKKALEELGTLESVIKARNIGRKTRLLEVKYMKLNEKSGLRPKYERLRPIKGVA